MKSPDLYMDEMNKMLQASTVVRAYSHSEAARALVALLDALIETYKMDLMQVKPDKLVELQSKLFQTVAIRNVVADATSELPRI